MMEIVLRWLGKDCDDIMEITTLESPKCIAIRNKYK